MTSEPPTRCVRCGHELFLRAEGREVCELCRLGRVREADKPAVKAAKPVVERPPCDGCGLTEVPDHPGLKLALADGYCLSCLVKRRNAEVGAG